MASSSFTDNLGLCLWDETDKPKRMDFVADNMIIDEKLGDHLNDSNIHITQQERERFLKPYTILSYAGDGNAERSFSLSDTYSFVFVIQKFYPSVSKDTQGNFISHFSFASRLYGSSGEITLTNSELIVTQDSEPVDGVKNNFNEDKGQYIAILFK